MKWFVLGFFVVLVFSVLSECQVAKTDFPEPSHNYLTWKELFHDKKWSLSTATFLGATAFDYTMTVRGTERRRPSDGARVCVEGNQDLPLDPHAGDVAKNFAITHVPVLVMGTFIHKVTGRSKWASWIYPSMMAYGTQLHVRGGMSWFKCQ